MMKRYWKQVLYPLFDFNLNSGITVINCDSDLLLELTQYCMNHTIRLAVCANVDCIADSFLQRNSSTVVLNQCVDECNILIIGDRGLSFTDEVLLQVVYNNDWDIIVNANSDLKSDMCEKFVHLQSVISIPFGGLHFLVKEKYVSFLKDLLYSEAFIAELENDRNKTNILFEKYRLKNESAKRYIYNEQKKIREEEIEEVKRDYKKKIAQLKESKRYKIGSKIADATSFLRKKEEKKYNKDKLPKSKRLDELVKFYELNLEQEIFELYYRYSMIHKNLETPWTPNEELVIQFMENIKEKDIEKYKSYPQEKKVSIIMPTYNRSDIICKAIDSVVAQSYQNWELIIIDDYSEDNTKEVIKKYSDDIRIKYVFNSHIKGVCGARNKGLEVATGEYITYLDTDNEWDDNFLLLSINKLLEKKEFKSLYSAQRVWTWKDEKFVIDNIRFGVYAISYCENRNYVDLNSYIHERTLYQQLGGFDESLTRMTDWELILRYSRHSYPYSYAVILCNYYKNGKVMNRISEIEDENFSLFASKFNYNKLNLPESDIVIENGYEMYSNAELKIYGKSDKKVAIIIPSYEALECLILCIAAIRKYTYNYDYEIIIVDNCSSMEMQNYLNSIKDDGDITVIQNEYNMGFTYAVNQGIKAAREGSDYVLLNNDAIVTENWLEELYIVKERIPAAGLIVPRQELIPHTNTMRIHVPRCNENREIDVNLSYHHKNIVNVKKYAQYGYVQLSFAAFFLVMITKDCYKKLGLLDEINGRHYKSDRLYCMNAEKNGIEMIYTPFSKAYHLLQQSTKQLKKKDSNMYDIIFRKNNWDDLKDKNVEHNI